MLGNIRANPEIYDLYETLKAFSRIENTATSLLEKEKIGTVPTSDEILEIQVSDYGEGGVEPTRLATAVLKLTELCTDLFLLLAIENHRITIKYLDSGSDFRIGVEGVKELVQAVGALFLQFWDKFRFRDHETFEKDIEALAKGLEFISKAKESIEKGAITDEEGRILRARVFRGVDDLVGLGVTLPPSSEGAAEERKQLLEKRSTKLLTTGHHPPAEASAAQDKSGDARDIP